MYEYFHSISTGYWFERYSYTPNHNRNYMLYYFGSAGKCMLKLWTHTHPFNGPLSGTARVSQYQKGKTSLDFTEARDNEWQWHQLGRMQVCISLQTDNHAGTPPISFYRPDALPDTQPTTSKHWRQVEIMKWNGIEQLCIVFYIVCALMYDMPTGGFSGYKCHEYLVVCIRIYCRVHSWQWGWENSRKGNKCKAVESSSWR